MIKIPTDIEIFKLLFEGIIDIYFFTLWIIPIMWGITVIEAITLNELLPLGFAWAFGLTSDDKELVKGKVKKTWDDINMVVSYIKKFLYVAMFLLLIIRLGDMVWYVLGA